MSDAPESKTLPPFSWRDAPPRYRRGYITALVGLAILGTLLPYQRHGGALLLAWVAELVLLAGVAMMAKVARRQVPCRLALLAGLLLVAKVVLLPLDDQRGDGVMIFIYTIPAVVLLILASAYRSRPIPPPPRKKPPKEEPAPTGERIIEMTWRCGHCSHQNLGRHTTCKGCGHAMGGSEQYEMPADTSKAVTVTDVDLLRMAEAGPNWRCAYCRSDQRSLDGSCKECGADSPPSPKTAPTDEAPPPAYAAALPATANTLTLAALAVVVATALPAWLLLEPLWTKVTVREMHWTHDVTVSKIAVFDGEGFAEKKQAGAFDVVAQGMRFHHNDKVCVREGQQHYTERVQDGYNEERYSERVKCGESCTSRPKSCRESCTSRKNGFASCRTVCSGGGQSCTSRYCNESRTRRVPRYKNVDRTRTVCVEYKDVPREAEWYRWRYRDWRQEKVLHLAGDDAASRWPTPAELDVGAPPEETRVTKAGSYRILFVDRRGRTFPHGPTGEEDFRRYSAGSRHRLRVEEGKVMEIRPL